MGDVSTGTAAPPDVDPAALIDTLLDSVSHDLRSPLLTISVGADLIAEAVTASDARTRTALEALRSGAKDLEHLLDAVTVLSRACSGRSPEDVARAQAWGADCAHQKPARLGEWRALLRDLLTPPSVPRPTVA